MVAGRHFFGEGETGQIPGPFADCGPGHIHGCVACADDDNPLSQRVAVRIVQIIDAKMNMSQGFSLDMKSIRLPYACPHENRLVTVSEQIVNPNRTANMGVGAELDAL